MTDPQADLTERARACVKNFWGWFYGQDNYERIVGFVAATLQSEREAAAAALQSERAQRAMAYNQLFDDYQKAVREKEAAAVEARRAAIEECHKAYMRWNVTLNEAYRAGLKDAQNALPPILGGSSYYKLAVDAIDALASLPAPQEETR